MTDLRPESSSSVTAPKPWRPWPVIAGIAVAVAALAVLLLIVKPGRSDTGTDHTPATGTNVSGTAEEQVVAACRRSILERADDHPVLGDPDVVLTWETDTATHTGVGSYDVEGTVSGQLHTADWQFAYTCKVAAAQGGDGTGRWTVVDNGFEQTR